MESLLNNFLNFIIIVNILLYVLIFPKCSVNAQHDTKNLNSFNTFDASSNEIIGYYHKPSNTITNITATIGKIVHFNCSFATPESNFNSHLKYNPLRIQSQSFINGFNDFRPNPTWLKADAIYDQNGVTYAFKTENIIVTRKGIIPDVYKDKMKLLPVNEQLQILRLNDIEIKDEGKYICREFNSKFDKLFYLNVYCKIILLSLIM